ncbi:MAG: urease accessory UreF family protein [Cyanobacteriota bacterium]
MACLRAQEGSRSGLRDLQTQLNAACWATKPRQASLDLSKRLAQLAERTWGIQLLTYAEEGLNHCLVFGLFGVWLGLRRSGH